MVLSTLYLYKVNDQHLDNNVSCFNYDRHLNERGDRNAASWREKGLIAVIDEVEKQIAAWISDVHNNVPVRTVAPGEIANERCFGLYLLDLLPAPPTEQGPSKLFQLILRFLVTAWADTPEESHRLLGELALSLSEHPVYDLELTPLPAQSWSAFGVAPRPSFMLRAPLQKERSQPVVKLIREPMVLRESPLVALEGVVLGPDEIPITGAFVELVSSQQSTYTDQKGRFVFPAVPAVPSRKKLRVKAKGRELAVLAEHRADAPEPIMIHVDIAEV